MSVERCPAWRAEDLIMRGATVLDVRMDFEYAHGHIRGSLNIPLSRLPDRLDEIPADRPVLVVCGHGNRSSVAADQLAGLGYDARLLDGGLTAWQGGGRPLERGL